MQWKSDLESLVEQTKAMVRSANLRGAELARANEASPLRELGIETSVPRTNTASPPRVTEVSRPRVTEVSRPRVTEVSPPRVTAASPPRVTEVSLPRVTAASPPPVTAAAQEREDIRQRVAGFKAHQEKLRREREQYYLEMTAKLRDMLQNGGQTKK
jgi:hypothetical protein